VQIQSITPEIAENLGLKDSRGALVAEPEPNGPASKAGIQAGDIVTAVNGRTIADSRELARTLSAMRPGTTARLTVLRKGQERTMSVTLAELPELREAALTLGARDGASGNLPQLGLTVAPKAEGLVVTDVDPDGTAADRGLKAGDVILDAGGKKVATAADLRGAVQTAEKGGKKTLLMRVRSGTTTKYVTLPVGRG
jgi:serine protease Do